MKTGAARLQRAKHFKEILLALALLLPGVAVAQDAWLDLVGSPLLISKSGKDMKIANQGSSDKVILQSTTVRIQGATGTPVADVGSSGVDFTSSASNIRVPEYVATPATALTPAAGTNDFKPNTVIAAAGPTNMAIALPASPTDGERRWGYNGSANPVVVAALGTPVMNGGASRRTVWPTKTFMHCRYSAALVEWECYPSAAVPTPIA